MVVEDEVLIGLMLAKKLRSFGYVVGEVATTGEEAVERTGQEHPQVILMDVTLAGEINGIEAARQIKKSTASQSSYSAAMMRNCFTSKLKR